jgi:hypothetical protein
VRRDVEEHSAVAHPIINERVRELLILVESSLPIGELREQVRDLRLAIDKMIEALKAS